jgi:hypothetical protein
MREVATGVWHLGERAWLVVGDTPIDGGNRQRCIPNGRRRLSPRRKWSIRRASGRHGEGGLILACGDPNDAHLEVALRILCRVDLRQDVIHRNGRVPMLDPGEQHSAGEIAGIHPRFGRCPITGRRGKLGAADELPLGRAEIDEDEIARSQGTAVRLACVDAPHPDPQEPSGSFSRR